jgi:transposase
MEWTVAIGVDTHKEVHVAVAVDALCGQLDRREIATTPAGSGSLLAWARELGVPAFAVEGTSSYGAGLARFLERAGVNVFECERPRRQERRGGKSDLIDATLAARRLLSGEPLCLPRGGGRREDLRLLLLERRGAVQARNAALNQLRALLVTAPDQMRARLGARSGDRLARAAARLRPSAEVINGILRRVGRRVKRLSREVAVAERAPAALVAEVAPTLLEESGVGPVCGAQLLVSSGDPGRMRSEASLPRSPAPARSTPRAASSGVTGSTAAATANSTGLSTSSPSHQSATTPRPAPTISGYSPPARPRGKHAAASSARSPATSTNACANCRRSLDNIEASMELAGREPATSWVLTRRSMRRLWPASRRPMHEGRGST